MRPQTVITLRDPDEQIKIADDQPLTGFTMESDTWLTMSGPNGHLHSVPVSRVVSVETWHAREHEH